MKSYLFLPGLDVATILTPVSFNAKRSTDCSKLLYCASSNGKKPANYKQRNSFTVVLRIHYIPPLLWEL